MPGSSSPANAVSPRIYSTSSGSPANLRRVNDELRMHITKLKAELEMEKAKSKQVHRDKVVEIKRLKDEYDADRLLATDMAAEKLKTDHELELKKLRESLTLSLQKEKEHEIKQILKFKDEELKMAKKMLVEDRDLAVRETEEKLKKEYAGRLKDGISDNDWKLKQELIEVKKLKQQFEDLYKQKLATDSEKNDIIKKLKEDHEKEIQRLLRDTRRETTRNIQELKSAQKALQEKEQLAAKKEFQARILEEEKEHLSDKLRSEARKSLDQMDNQAPVSMKLMTSLVEWVPFHYA